MREEYAIPGGGHFQEFVQMHIDTFKELGFNEGGRSQVSSMNQCSYPIMSWDTAALMTRRSDWLL